MDYAVLQYYKTDQNLGWIFELSEAHFIALVMVATLGSILSPGDSGY